MKGGFAAEIGGHGRRRAMLSFSRCIGYALCN